MELRVSGHQDPFPDPLGAGEHIGEMGREVQGLAWGTQSPEHRVGLGPCQAGANFEVQGVLTWEP